MMGTDPFSLIGGPDPLFILLCETSFVTRSLVDPDPYPHNYVYNYCL